MSHPGMGDDLENCNPGTLHAIQGSSTLGRVLPSPRAVLTARITWGKEPCESSQFQGFPEASVVYSLSLPSRVEGFNLEKFAVQENR